MENFKERLNHLVKKGESGIKFATRCGVKPATMNGYLNGKFEPTVEILIKIATACNVRVGWLAAGELPKELDRQFDLHDDMINVFAGKCESMDEALEFFRTKLKKIYPIEGGKGKEKNDTNLFDIQSLQSINDWLLEQIKKDPEYVIDFALEFRKKFPEYNEWREKKRAGSDILSDPRQRDNRHIA